MEDRTKYRTVITYKSYFTDFLVLQNPKVKEKIAWTLKLIEEIQKVLETYLCILKKPKGFMR